MSKIEVKDLTFCYEGSYENVFSNVSFVIDSNWKLGLIGKNGMGKTTFLNILQDKYDYTGKIDKNIECEYFPFEVINTEEKTIDIINSIINNTQEEWKIMRELNLINSDTGILYQNYSTLSEGEKVKVLLVTLFLKENKFLLIDEPTNHLDEKAREEVCNYLNSKKGYIVVSHDRAFLNNVVDHIICINNKKIDVQKGNYNSYKENKEREDNFEINQNEKLEKDIEKLNKAIKQTAKWSDDVEKTKCGTRVSGLRPDRGYIGHQAAKMMQRSKSIEKRKSKEIEQKEMLLKNIDVARDLVMKPSIFVKKDLIVANDFSIHYGEKVLFQKLNFKISVGQRVAIVGKNGCGKTSLLKVILGKDIDYTGNISIAKNMKISYVSQNTNEVVGDISEYAKLNNVDESVFRAMLQKLGVNTSFFERDISLMSEGQKKKILLARSISETADVYVWDEPLNYIDIISREQIENAILKYMPTMIFVEHDKTFRDNIATSILSI